MSLDALLPVLYLKGISTGDFQEAFSAIMGPDAPNLSPSVISRLTAGWQGQYDAWTRRDLSARHDVYMWAERPLHDTRHRRYPPPGGTACMLVIIGAMYDAGFSEEGLFDILSATALDNFMNRMLEGAGINRHKT